MAQLRRGRGRARPTATRARRRDRPAGGRCERRGGRCTDLVGRARPTPVGVAAASAWVASLLFRVACWSSASRCRSHLPEGRIVDDGRSRLLWRIGFGGWCVWVVGAALRPGLLDTVSVANPVGWPGGRPVLGVVGTVGAVVLTVTAVVAYGRLVVRWRRAGPQSRRAMAFLALGSMTTLLLFGCASVAQALGVEPPTWFAGLAVVLVVSAFPVSVGLAIHRARLLDIELVLRRTLTYLAMTLVVVDGLRADRARRRASWSSNTDRLVDVPAGDRARGRRAEPAAGAGPAPGRPDALRPTGRPYGVLRDWTVRSARARRPPRCWPSVCRGGRAARCACRTRGRAGGAEPGRRRVATACRGGRTQPVERELELSHHGRQVGTCSGAPRVAGRALHRQRRPRPARRGRARRRPRSRRSGSPRRRSARRERLVTGARGRPAPDPARPARPPGAGAQRDHAAARRAASAQQRQRRGRSPERHDPWRGGRRGRRRTPARARPAATGARPARPGRGPAPPRDAVVPGDLAVELVVASAAAAAAGRGGGRGVPHRDRGAHQHASARGATESATDRASRWVRPGGWSLVVCDDGAGIRTETERRSRAGLDARTRGRARRHPARSARSTGPTISAELPDVTIRVLVVDDHPVFRKRPAQRRSRRRPRHGVGR